MVTFPPGWERTPPGRRKRAAFSRDLTLNRAYEELMR